MHTKIQKWGNSLGLRIPSSFADEVSVRAGSTVDLSLDEGNLVVRPVETQYELSDLLDAVTDDNLHREFDVGTPKGREIW